jgi:hypothetical protein
VCCWKCRPIPSAVCEIKIVSYGKRDARILFGGGDSCCCKITDREEEKTTGDNRAEKKKRSCRFRGWRWASTTSGCRDINGRHYSSGHGGDEPREFIVFDNWHSL